MASPSDVFKNTKAYFHALSKVNTEITQYVFESKYKTGHSVRLGDVWAEEVGYAETIAEADNFVISNPFIVKKYTLQNLTEIPGSNGQGYYINDGEFIQSWISPTDVPHEITKDPSLGYEAKLYQSDDTFIPPTSGVFVIDYYAGIVLFQEGYTPADMGWGTPKITCYVYIGKRGVDSSKIELDYGDINSHYSGVINQNETKDIAIFNADLYRTFEFLISVTDGETGNFFSSKIVAQYNNTDVDFNHFAILGTKTVDFDVIYESGKVKLQGTGLKNNQQVKTISQAVEISDTMYSSSSSSSSSSTTINDFILKVKTDNTGTSNDNQFTLPLRVLESYDFIVDWGDSSIETITESSNVTHIYPSVGEYYIKIRGIFPAIYFNNTGDKLKLIDVVQWGDIEFNAFDSAFYGCSNCEFTATDTINTQNVVNMSHSFEGCLLLNSPSINTMDTSNVTNMTSMFADCSKFNQSISNFDTSNVINMELMFKGCNEFNQSVSNFDTSNVINFYHIFSSCNEFNQSVSNFDTSNATNMGGMFNNCFKFNQPVDNFNTSNVTDMLSMFADCSVFNQSVSNFDTSSVTDMSNMFGGCLKFNQSVSNFDTSKVTNMIAMFKSCSVFNQSVSNFDTSNVTNMTSMFDSCSVFNQSVSNFNTSNVTDMSNMFYYCKEFNQSVSNFDTSNVTNMRYLFNDCSVFNQSVSNFDTSSVTDMSNMFGGCLKFNQSVSNFDTSNVTNMRYLFNNCNKFNQSVSNFNTSNVTDMSCLFNSCYEFNQPLDNFDTSKTTSFYFMFYHAYKFNYPIDNFDTSNVTNMMYMFYGTLMENIDLTLFDISSLTDARAMIVTNYFTTEQYDELLISWNNKPHQNNVPFQCSAKYTGGGDAEAARNELIADGWTITDGGQA